jgi:hypothetical protein
MKKGGEIFFVGFTARLIYLSIFFDLKIKHKIRNFEVSRQLS